MIPSYLTVILRGRAGYDRRPRWLSAHIRQVREE